MDFPQLLLFASHFSAWFACVTKNTVSTTRGNEQKIRKNHIFPSTACEATKMTETPKIFFRNFNTLLTTTDRLMDI